jgi:hypothetical protein
MEQTMGTPGRVGTDTRTFTRPEAVWYLRHAEALARWPVLTEAWAQAVERRRLAEQAPAPDFRRGQAVG